VVADAPHAPGAGITHQQRNAGVQHICRWNDHRQNGAHLRGQSRTREKGLVAAERFLSWRRDPIFSDRRPRRPGPTVCTGPSLARRRGLRPHRLADRNRNRCRDRNQNRCRTVGMIAAAMPAGFAARAVCALPVTSARQTALSIEMHQRPSVSVRASRSSRPWRGCIR
jgi:hypothetical protein